jgi:hypothetical protein
MANAAGFLRAIGPNAQLDLALSTIDIPCTTAFNTHILPMRCPRRKVGLPEQFSLFADKLSGPEGLRYADEFVSPAAEKTLIGHIAGLPLQPFQFGQYEGKRRVASFGFRYDYTVRRLEEADPIPEWLGSIIEKVEAFAAEAAELVRSFAPSATSVSASAGTGTSRTSTGCSACRWARRASSGFAGPPTPGGSVSRSRLGHVRST